MEYRSEVRSRLKWEMMGSLEWKVVTGRIEMEMKWNVKGHTWHYEGSEVMVQ